MCPGKRKFINTICICRCRGLLMHDIWNPWRGCTKKSPGCEHCYMYFLDKQRGHDGAHVYRVKNNFDYPLHKNKEQKSGKYL